MDFQWQEPIPELLTAGIYLSAKPEEVVIRYNPNGTPFIDGITKSLF